MVGAAPRATVRRRGRASTRPPADRRHLRPADRRTGSRRLRRGRCRKPQNCSTSLGHDVFEATPPWREPGLLDTFIAVWQVGPALYAVEAGSLLTPLNRGLAESARRTLRRRLRASARSHLQMLARRIVAFWQRRRRRAHAHTRASAGSDRLARGRCRRRGRTAGAEHAVHAVHSDREPHRVTGDVTPVALVGGRTSHRRPGDRAASRRGASPSPGGTAGRGSTVGRQAAADLLSGSHAVRDPDLLPRSGVKHAGRVSSRDRDRHVPVAVLVQDHVSRPGVGERPRHDRVVALAGVLELELRA